MFFHAQGPQVQQRVFFRRRAEVIPCGSAEVSVGDEKGAGSHRPAQSPQVIAVQNDAAESQHDRNQAEVGGHDAPDSPEVKGGQGERSLLQAADEASANQISGDDKEDVHACIASRADPFLQMVQDDGQHGKSTQAVNVREIGSVDGAFGLVGRR